MGPRLRELIPAARGGQDAGSHNLGPVVLRNSVLKVNMLTPVRWAVVCTLNASTESFKSLLTRFLWTPAPLFALGANLKSELSKDHEVQSGP